MANTEPKQVKNVLTDWQLDTEFCVPTIVGKVLIDQPAAGAKRGDFIRTSQIQRIYTVEDAAGISRFAETRNSLYHLVG